MKFVNWRSFTPHTVVLHDVVVRVVHVEVGPETRSHYGAGYDGEDSADLVVDR